MEEAGIKSTTFPQICCHTTLRKVSGQLYCFKAQLIAWEAYNFTKYQVAADDEELSASYEQQMLLEIKRKATCG